MGTIVLKMTAEQISTLQKDLANYATATKNPYASFFSQGRWNKCHRLYFRKGNFQGAKPEVLAAVLDTKLNLSIHLMGKTSPNWIGRSRKWSLFWWSSCCS